MKKNLRSSDELDLEIEQFSKTITEAYDFFNYLRGFDFGIKDVLKTIHIDKYDEATKDYNGVHFYLALKRRCELISHLEYSKYLENEGYHDYIDGYTDEDIEDELTPYPLSEQMFNLDKNESIKEALIPVSAFLEEIFFGNALAVTRCDMMYLSDWRLTSGVKAIDMAYVSYRNRNNGIMGGMNDEECNKTISDIILNKTNSFAFDDVKKIPAGYGWESDYLGRSTIWAEVDLSVPDDILVEGFKNWLAYAREKHGELFGNGEQKKEIKNHFKISLLKRWRSLRVLAYLDMKILAEFFNQNPTLKQYGDALYFDEYDIDTTEKVRKTLIPVVQDIMNGHCLDDLMRMMHAEDRIF